MFINPYIAGNPARADGFFGRRDILDWVEEELRGPHTNALVIFGQRRIGKTSLLLKMESSLPGETFFPVYFDLQDKAKDPLPRLLRRLASAIARRVGIPKPEMAVFEEDGEDYFCDVFLPLVYEHIGDGVRVVLLFDEFEVIDHAEVEDLSNGSAAKSFHPFLHELMARDTRLAFIFATGRSTEDLSLETRTTFKASLQKHVWVLDRASAEALIRQGETQGNLVFTNDAIDKILKLTSGHPYLTQLLCHQIWILSERRHRNQPLPHGLVDRRERGTAQSIQPKHVREAFPEALETGDNALVWIWEGLAPAEKVFAAAMGGLTSVRGSVSLERVMETLARYAPKQRTREVELAARDLVKRRILKWEDENKLCFEVVIFQQWVMERKPLREVEGELDRLKPEAEKVYILASRQFQQEQWSQAASSLTQVLDRDPQHVNAHLDLGECHLQMGNIQEAVAALEKAYRLSPGSSRLSLVRALILQARDILPVDAMEALNICNHIRHLSPREPEIVELTKAVWKKKGDDCLAESDREQALYHYKKADHREGVTAIRQYRARCRYALGEIIEKIELAELVARKISSSCRLKKLARWRNLQPNEPLVVVANLYRAEEGALHALIGAMGDLGRGKPRLLREKLQDIQAPLPEPTEEISWRFEGVELGVLALLAVDFISALERIANNCTELESEFDDKMYVAGWREVHAFLQERGRVANHYLTVLVGLQEEKTDIVQNGLAPFEENYSGPVPIEGLSVASQFMNSTMATDVADVQYVAFSPDEKYLASVSAEMISLWLVATGQQAQFFENKSSTVCQVIFSPDSSCLLAMSQNGTMDIWSIVGNSFQTPPRKSLQVDGSPRAAVFSPDGCHLAVGMSHGGILMWSQEMGAWSRAFQSGQGEISSLAYSDDGRFLAAGFVEGFIQLWRLEDKRVEVFDEHDSAVSALAFSPDGKLLASGGESGLLRVWDFSQDIVFCEENRHTERINALAFSSSGSMLTTCSLDQTARLWCSPYWRCAAMTDENRGGVLGCMFSADEANVYLVLPTRRLRIWTVSQYTVSQHPDEAKAPALGRC